MTTNFFYGLLCAIMGHVGVWYCHNSQLVWPWWENKPILANILFGLPSGIAFWYATKILMAETQELWSVRFLAFAASYFVFPLLTYFYLQESPFTFKTVLCTLLAFLIISIQIFIK